MNHPRWRTPLGATAVGLCALLVAPAAVSKITEVPEDRTAAPMAKAMMRKHWQIRRSVFPVIPPSGVPAAVSTTHLADFPRNGPRYAILSTGNAKIAPRPNNKPDSGRRNKGLTIRGARDVVMMRIGFVVPKKHNCMTFNFRFLSEEYPEFVKDIYNDTFIAELDRTTWRSRRDEPTVVSPGNFAVDRDGNPIRVNAVGDATMTAEQSEDTTYDGATRVLRASTRVKPGGRHNLYLSLFDQGDRIFDSVVFLDNMGTTAASDCQTGISVED